MSRRKESVLSYRKHCPYEVTFLNPKKFSPDECRKILSNHIGTNSTIYIEEGATTTDILGPQILFDAKKQDPTDQQNFLNTKASSIQRARRVFIKTSNLRFYRN